MPEAGTIEPSVLFFVRVAAEELILESDMSIFSFLFSIFFDFTGHAGLHEAHHIFKPLLFETGRAQISTPTTDGPFRFRKGASQLAGRADIHTGPAESADLGTLIKGCPKAPFLAPAAKPDGLGHHLFFTHPSASSA
jgi:hypothetical protein